MEKRKVILDCDPGHDDAIAIMLAGKSKAIDLLGVVTVAGNQTLEKTVKNSLNVCQFLGLDVPVYKGSPRPLVREKPVIADDIHGESGLEGPTFDPLTRMPEEKRGVLYIVDTLMQSEGDITVVTTGPMTDLALAMRIEPQIIPKICEIVLMGGSYQNGNVTPAAEFNIMADADAAHIVFTCGRPITMVGLDVTRKALCYPSIVERMKAHQNPAGKLFADLMGFFNKTQKEVFGWDGGPLHDPITITYLIDPSVITTKPMFSQVDIRSEQSYGRTNCDYFGYLQKEPNVNVAIDIDIEKFWDIVEQTIKLYD